MGFKNAFTSADYDGDLALAFELQRVGAAVALADFSTTPSGAGIVVRPRSANNDERLQIQARTFAVGRGGRRIESAHWHISIGLWRRGPNAIVKRYTGPPLPADPDAERCILKAYRLQLEDIEDAINWHLGRDRDREPPPRLGWGSLLKALRAEGISASEDEFVAAPFVFEFADEIIVELDRR